METVVIALALGASCIFLVTVYSKKRKLRPELTISGDRQGSHSCEGCDSSCGCSKKK